MWFVGVDIVEHLRRARRDAEIAALAVVDVDGDGAATRDRARRRVGQSLRHAPPPRPGTRSRGGGPSPRASARSFVSMCWVRYDGIDCRIASTSASQLTMPVIAAYAPSITIEAAERVAELGRDAGRGDAVHRRIGRDLAVNVESLTSTRPPGRSFACDGLPVLVVHRDRRPRVRHDRRRLDRAVARRRRCCRCCRRASCRRRARGT